MSGRPDGSNNGALESKGRILEKGEEGLHETGDVRLDIASEDLEEAVERRASGTLSFGVSDELRDEL